MILLKAQWLTSQQVVTQVGCCEVVVNTWLARYQDQGLDGLKTRRGQGRRPILQAETDLAAVCRAVQNNRQRVSLAKAELTKKLSKEFSALTLRRFLKKGGRFKHLRRQVNACPTPTSMPSSIRSSASAAYGVFALAHVGL